MKGVAEGVMDQLQQDNSGDEEEEEEEEEEDIYDEVEGESEPECNAAFNTLSQYIVISTYTDVT